VLLIGQQHSLDDDKRHIDHLLPAFSDKRYIKINGKPLFLVYRTELLPAPAQTAALWRKRAQAAGFPDLYLVRVESWGTYIDPATIGFDAVVEFAPDFRVLRVPVGRREHWDTVARLHKRLRNVGIMSKVYMDNTVHLYNSLVERMLAKPPVDYTRFRCVMPGWDNSPRRSGGATIIHDSTPEAYEAWLQAMVRESRQRWHGDERILFINAWTEWAEGNHLEPDQRHGLAYLEATERSLALTDP
jgi:hypothetical protein